MDLAVAFTPTGICPGLTPERRVACTIEAWRRALHASTTPLPLPVVALQPSIVAPAMPQLSPVEPANPAELPAVAKSGDWAQARALFHAPRQPDEIALQNANGTYIPVAEWNAKPSRVETFLHSSQTKQTITGIALLVMLLLWIF